MKKFFALLFVNILVIALFGTLYQYSEQYLYFYIIGVFLLSAIMMRSNLDKNNLFFGLDKLLYYATLLYALIRIAAFAYFHFNGERDYENIIFLLFYGLQIGLIGYTYLSFLLKMSNQFNKKQLVLDFSIYTYYCAGLIIAFFLNKYSEFFDYKQILLISLFTILSVALAITMLMIMASAIKIRLRRYLLFILAGFCYVSYLSSFYLLVILDAQIDLVWAQLFIVLGAVNMMIAILAKREYPKLNDISALYNFFPENFGKINYTWLIFAIPVVMYALHILYLHQLVVFLFGITIYQFASYYLQSGIKVEMLLSKELDMKRELEQEIENRTEQLRRINVELKLRTKYDALTELYNRKHLYKIIEQKIVQAEPFSLLYIDLDHFKVINDIHGHGVGDGVLITLAKRLKRLRAEGIFVARIGGDEFAVLTTHVDRRSLGLLCESIIGFVRRPILVEGLNLMVGVSIGIALFPNDARDAQALMKYADIAMYQAKAGQQNEKYVYYSEKLISHIEKRNKIEALLKEINMDQAFELHYQPVVNLETCKIIGVEAFIRWKSQTLGSIAPSEFIPIAENSGYIYDISNWIFLQAMTQIKVWNETYDRRLKVGINLSPVIVNHVQFLESFKNIFEQLELDPALVELEITENPMMFTSDYLVSIFKSLRKIGVSLAIDDFGTGYSSLSYLKKYDVSCLKIAKVIIDNIEHNDDDLLIVNAIIMMAEGLGLEVIAEGVETDAQLAILRKLKCPNFQGFVYDKALPAEQLEEIYLA